MDKNITKKKKQNEIGSTIEPTTYKIKTMIKFKISKYPIFRRHVYLYQRKHLTGLMKS